MDPTMLLAQVEQSESSLTVIPMKTGSLNQYMRLLYVIFVMFSILLTALACMLYTTSATHSVHRAIEKCLAPAIMCTLIAVFYVGQLAITHQPEPPFTFDLTANKVLRDGQILGHLGSIMKVALFFRASADAGRQLRLSLIMTNFDEWKILETSTFSSSESSEISLHLFAYDEAPITNISPDWVYCSNRFLAASASECEICVIANLISEYITTKSFGSRAL